MNLIEIKYKGFVIQKNKDSHSALIYKDGFLLKCIAGDILKDGSENSIEKAKNYIDSL